MDLSKRIQALRNKHGMTQLQLAEILSVTDRAISKWEQGRGNPDIETLPLLSRVFDVSIDYLLTGCDFVSKEQLKIESIIEECKTKVRPMAINEERIDCFRKMMKEKGLELFVSSFDICYQQYLLSAIVKDDQLAFEDGLMKIGGIMHNQVLNPIEKRILYFANCLNKKATDKSLDNKNVLISKIKEYLSNKGYESEDEALRLVEYIGQRIVDDVSSYKGAFKLIKREMEPELEEKPVEEREFEYLSTYNIEPIKASIAIKQLNHSIKEGDYQSMTAYMCNAISEVLREMIVCANPKINRDQIPDINGYAPRLYKLFEGYLDRKICRNISKLVTEYFIIFEKVPSEEGFELFRTTFDYLQNRCRGVNVNLIFTNSGVLTFTNLGV